MYNLQFTIYNYFKKHCTFYIARPALQTGVTLIELLLYMSLLIIFMTVLTNIFVSSLEVQLDSKSLSSTEEDGRFLLQRLIYDIHRSDTITTPTTLGQTTSTLQFTVNTTSYTYALNGTALGLNDGTGVNQLNSFNTNISNLSFTRLGNVNGKNTIRVSLRVSGKTQKQSGIDTRDFTTTIGLR